MTARPGAGAERPRQARGAVSTSGSAEGRDRPRRTPHAPAPEPPPTARRRLRGDHGVSMLEFAGFLPFLLIIGMAAIQLGLVGYGASQAGSAAARRHGRNP
ncbi:TadE/TadG family type IV pilus assembly protein [Streptomyces sp. Q6]|uniref:TadE/TadG family type IV pilus assembly protein n=1 Tax=Streptomyces citrinus TaxID=3118173 RepID=A0ACD5AKE6_9ACTN